MTHIRVEIVELKCIDDEEVEDEIYWYHCIDRGHGQPPTADGGAPEMPIQVGHARRGNRQGVDIDDGETYVPPTWAAILYDGDCGAAADDSHGEHEAEGHQDQEEHDDVIAGSIYLFEEDDKDERPEMDFSINWPMATRLSLGLYVLFGSIGGLIANILLSPIILPLALIEFLFSTVADRPDYLGGVGVRIPCAGAAEEFRSYRFTGSSKGATFHQGFFGMVIPWITDHGRAEYVMKIKITRR